MIGQVARDIKALQMRLRDLELKVGKLEKADKAKSVPASGRNGDGKGSEDKAKAAQK